MTEDPVNYTQQVISYPMHNSLLFHYKLCLCIFRKTIGVDSEDFTKQISHVIKM